MTDEKWISDDHRIQFRVRAEEGLQGNVVANPFLELVCPGPLRCKAPMRNDAGEIIAGCNLREWFSLVGPQDFMENNARLAPGTTRSLPFRIEYRWEGWGEEAEPVWRPADA